MSPVHPWYLIQISVAWTDTDANSTCDRQHNRRFKPIFILLIVDTLSIRLRTYLMVPIKETFLGAADDDVRPCYNEVVYLHALHGWAMWMVVTDDECVWGDGGRATGLPFLLDQEHGRRGEGGSPGRALIFLPRDLIFQSGPIRGSFPPPPPSFQGSR